jgi:hypothetical protein
LVAHPRADGDCEALRLLLIARQELTTASTAQTNRPRALLLNDEDTERQLARGALTDTIVVGKPGDWPSPCVITAAISRPTALS